MASWASLGVHDRPIAASITTGSHILSLSAGRGARRDQRHLAPPGQGGAVRLGQQLGEPVPGGADAAGGGVAARRARGGALAFKHGLSGTFGCDDVHRLRIKCKSRCK